jgi:ribonuclease PH
MEPDYGEGGGAAVEPSLSLRPMQCQQGELVRLDGSARFSHEGTSVLAAVAGPVAVQKRSELVGRATVDVVWKPASGAPGAEAKQVCVCVCSTVLRGLLRKPLRRR